MIQWKMNSPIGNLYLVSSNKGLKGVFWKKQKAPLAASLESSELEIQFLAQTVQELEQYFRGERKRFEIRLDIDGTEFQRRVWGELMKIPYGKTFSYSEIAKKIRNQNAVRAVGTANGRNPLSIIVPCHRVIAADGTLGGYAGGLGIKTKLLDLERRGSI